MARGRCQGLALAFRWFGVGSQGNHKGCPYEPGGLNHLDRNAILAGVTSAAVNCPYGTASYILATVRLPYDYGHSAGKFQVL